MRKFSLLSILPILAFAAVRWQVLKTDHFNLVYPKGYEFQARRAARWMETERSKPVDLVGYDPGKTWVVIEDMGMTVNGFSNPVGNEIHLFTTPPMGLDISTRDWMRTVGIHEYAHEVSLSSVWGLPKILGILLGPWVIPNMVTPGWLIEGVTVYTESHIVPYEGRLESGEYDVNILTRAAQGVRTRWWNMDGSLFEYPMGAIYAYGGPFYEWLVETKGEEAISTFYRKHGSRIPLFSLDRSARESFGERFPALLKDWQKSVEERARQFEPADSAARKLTEKGWYIYGAPVTDGERLYYARAYGRKLAANYGKSYMDIVALTPETGAQEVLIRPMTFVDLPLRVHDGVLYYAATVTGRGFANTSGAGFGDLKEIRSYDLATHRERKIYRGKVRAFDRMPDGSFLVSLDRENAQFGSALARINPNGGGLKKIWDGDMLIGEILVFNTGQVYCSARHQGENWDIWQLSESSGWARLTNTPWSESGLSLDPQGKLLYSANPYGTDGCLGSYLLDPQSGKIEEFKTPSYAQNPVVINDELVFIGVNPKGYDFYSLETSVSPASFPSPADKSPTEPSWDGKFERRSSCSPYLTLLRPWARVPFAVPGFANPFEGDWTLTYLILGMYLMGADVLGENSYNITAYYDVLGKTPSVAFSWNNMRLAPLSLNLGFNMDPVFSLADSLVGYTYTVYPSFSLPVVVRQGRGFQRLYWGEGFRLSGEALQIRSLQSSLGASFDWPYLSFGTSLWHSWSSPIFSSYEASYLGNRSVAALDLAGGILIGDVSTTLNLSADQEGDSLSAVIRGYESLKTGDALLQTATLEYRHRLLKMRLGIWNPNLFFEDLYVSVFADAAYDTRSILGASAGVMLTPEIRLLWGLAPIAPSFGVALTRELKPQFVFNMGFDIPLGAKNAKRDALKFVDCPEPELR